LRRRFQRLCISKMRAVPSSDEECILEQPAPRAVSRKVVAAAVSVGAALLLAPAAYHFSRPVAQTAEVSMAVEEDMIATSPKRRIALPPLTTA